MRKVARTALVCAASLALASAASSPAWAQSDADRATARMLGRDGQTALDAKDFKKAEASFRQADSLVHAPTLVLGLARALAGEGRLVEAQEAYMRIVREGVPPGAPEVFTHALDSAKHEVDQVAPRIGSMTISVQAAGGGQVPGVKVSVDDAPMNAASLGMKRVIDPGVHVVKVSADGYKSAELKVTVPPGGSADAPVSLEKDMGGAAAPVPPPPAPDTPPTPAPGTEPPPPAPEPASSGGRGPWPWVAFGVGGAGIGVGIVTGVLALGKHSALGTDGCSGGSCPQSAKSDLDAFHSMATISTVGFIVGGVGAAAGVALLFLLPKEQGTPATGFSIRPVLGPGSVGAVGAF